MTQEEFTIKYAKKFVVDHLDYNGCLRSLLTIQQQWEAFCLGDGFGVRTSDELKQINSGWDWSHVRDSSDAAWMRMANYIIKAARWNYANIEAAALNMWLQLQEAKVSMDDYFAY